MNPISVRRFGALTAAALVAAALTTVAAPADAATVDTAPANAGAAWLTAQVQSNGLLQSTYQGYTSPDPWTSADAALAQFATGHTTDGTNLVNALSANAGSYINNDGYAGYYSAGSTAKALVLAKLAGIDPTTFGPSGHTVNLVSTLEGLVAASGPSAGRIVDTVSPSDQYGADYGNSLGQAFAVRALTEQSAPQAASALSYLLQQQCEAGYFRVYFTEDKSAADQSCDGGLPTTGASYGDNSDPDVDATAYAIIELKTLDNEGYAMSAATARAVGKAEAWLMSMQNADGSFGSSPALPGANADSTGLAGWALGLAGDPQSANAAATWIRAHQAQNVAPCTDALTSQAGAIAHDDAALAHGRTAGIPAADAYSWNLSTAQALPSLNYYTPATPSTALKATATTAYVQAKTRTNITVSGLAAGAPACVSLGTTHLSVAAGLSGTVIASVLMPAGTANRSVSVANGAATASATVKVLDAKTFTLTPSTLKPRRGTSFTLRVSGLAPGERLTVKYAGRVVLRANATSKGTYSHAIAAGSSLGSKAILVTGQFSNRKGSKTITVVR
jgi:hypothetical protein